MNRTIHIEHYRDEGKMVFYTVRLDHREINETDLFINRFEDDSKFKEDLQIIIRALKNNGARGIRSDQLRPEKSAHAFPLQGVTGNLRLYCIHMNKFCIILCGGGAKSAPTAQEGPDTLPPFKMANRIEQALRTAMASKLITIDDDNRLNGDLTLQI